MTGFAEFTGFLAASVALTAVLIGTRWFLLKVLMHTHAGDESRESVITTLAGSDKALTVSCTETGEPVIETGTASAGLTTAAASEFDLRPAELAYLIRGGDISHSILVLAFDLIHRAVKLAGDESEDIQLRDYEEKIWDKTKDYVKGWAKQKTSHIVPEKKRISWLLLRAPRLIKAIAKNTRHFVSQVAKDPRNIRRYVSTAGVVRLAADFWSAGYQQMIADELEQHLTDRGLLVQSSSRERYSRAFTVLAVVSTIVLITISFWLLPHNLTTLLMLIFAVGNAALLRFLLGLLELVPIVHELNEVFDVISRDGIRLALVRKLLGALSLIVILVLVLLFVVLLALQWLVLNLVFQTGSALLLLSLLVLSMNCFVIIQIFLDSHAVRYRQQPSAAGARLVRQVKERVSGVSPMQSFGALLSNAEYEREFSEILAVYGIETLWLLA